MYHLNTAAQWAPCGFPHNMYMHMHMNMYMCMCMHMCQDAKQHSCRGAHCVAPGLQKPLVAPAPRDALAPAPAPALQSSLSL